MFALKRNRSSFRYAEDIKPPSIITTTCHSEMYAILKNAKTKDMPYKQKSLTSEDILIISSRRNRRTHNFTVDRKPRSTKHTRHPISTKSPGFTAFKNMYMGQVKSSYDVRLSYDFTKARKNMFELLLLVKILSHNSGKEETYIRVC